MALNATDDICRSTPVAVGKTARSGDARVGTDSAKVGVEWLNIGSLGAVAIAVSGKIVVRSHTTSMPTCDGRPQG